MRSFSPEMGAGGIPNGVLTASEEWCLPEPDAKHMFNPEMRKMLKGVGRGTMVLFEERFSRVAPDIASAHFNDLPGFERTREESFAHAVRFGELILTTEDERKLAAHVAVKPFDTPAEAAAEAGATMTVNEFPRHPRHPYRPHSFTPLGFWRDQNGGTSFVTRYDPEVITQDNIFWNPDQPPTDHEVYKAFSHAAVALGGLHRYGYTHGDAQVKNIGGDMVGVRYVDLESLKHLRNGQARERMRDDLGKYFTSLNARSSEDVSYEEPITDFLIPAYQRQIASRDSRVPEEVRLQPEEIVELVEYA